MTPNAFDAGRRFAVTRFGRTAWVEQGEGPAAIFVHGFPLNGYHWRGVMGALADVRRCIAPDLMGLGHTEVGEGQPLGFPHQAEMILAFMDSLGIDRADFVGNDSGCAILQLIAARAPERVASLTLTNGDAHDNYPPEAFRANHELAAAGQLAAAMAGLLGDIAFARSERAFGRVFEHPERLTQELLRLYLGAPLSTPARRAAFDRYAASIDNAATLAAYESLRRLATRVLVVWGDSDPFFDVRWAHWLGETFVNSRVEIFKGAKLFFPEERPDELARLVRTHWTGDAE